jgi:hypothetical protein
VKQYRRSGLRYVDLGGDAVLVEQNPAKSSEWAKAAREGKRIAWVLRDGEYLARVSRATSPFSTERRTAWRTRRCPAFTPETRWSAVALACLARALR